MLSGWRAIPYPLSPTSAILDIVRISSVPYLNARPLVAGLAGQPGVTVGYAVPAVLIAQTLAGEVDVAMASTFATFEHPELSLLPGLGVTAAGPAWSVRLLSRVPLPEIRTLALDACSRSTNALARIILADRYGVSPDCRPLPPDRDAMLAQADAAVLIGDIGLTVAGDALLDVDLGAEWWALTGLPFYFAGWVARDPAKLAEAAPLLHAACDDGLVHLREIADAEAVRLGLPAQRCYDYLAVVMRYRTGPAEEAGLAEFRARATRLGLVGV
jgi:chorismate dehydratase